MNEAEAKVVRQIFGLYQSHGRLSAVMNEANKLDLRSKRHAFSTGRTQGGNLFSRGQIYSLLRNPVYLGLIRHKDKMWSGKHTAILDQAIWDKVQAGLQHASGRPRGKLGVKDHTGATIKAAPLLGKFRDETGDILPPTHTLRHGDDCGIMYPTG